MRRLRVWIIVGKIGWRLAKWVLRRRRKRGIIGRVAAWDRATSRRVAEAVLPIPRWTVQVGAHLGDLWLWTLISGVLFWRWAGRWWWKWALSLGNAALGTLVLKRIFRRRRPLALRWLYGTHGDEYSFPSGHAARWGTILVWVWQWPRYAVLAFLAAAWTGWSRIRLGIHTIGDVVAGFSLGVFLTTLLRRFT